ncbi:DinB family protein [Chitinophaga sp. 212800010-3]|uniref:DinB family protein n=1 Tax=unclassified Chitinophaga TaxID=2619133 RepID=UPI002DF08A0C|nr:DinB family protein [Chitinophaga sp. 212800010-3]
MHTSLYPVELMLLLNERLFINALDGVTDEQADERMSPHSNPLIWIATHTLWARYNMLMFLGSPVNNPYQELFQNFRPYNPADDYPDMSAVKTDWNNVSALLKSALKNVTEAQLAADAPLKNPTGDFTNLGTLAFLAQHESYDIGQMAFLKKLFTKEAMKY